MAECVRQSSPSVARQEPEANMSEVEVLRRIKEPEMSKTMFWIVEELKNVDTHIISPAESALSLDHVYHPAPHRSLNREKQTI